MSILQVNDLRVTFTKGKRSFQALRGVSLELNPGETLAVVGESGCGKTTLARCVLGLQAFEGTIIRMGEAVHGVRAGQAKEVGVVWQVPYASLDPRWTIGDLILEPARLCKRDVNLEQHLVRCGLKPEFASRYPHQLSGGQRQRVAIARALVLDPAFVICDEPTSALDLSVQAQILNLLKDLQQEFGCAYLYISHDLSTVRYLSDRVAVMYLGEIVEMGNTEEVFESPRHPYTKLLMDSALTHERFELQAPPIELEAQAITGSGCAFAPRCPRAQSICSSEAPKLRGAPHDFSCHNPVEPAIKIP